MKRVLAVSLGLLALSACAEPTAPAAAPELRLGVASPNTTVSAEFTVYVGGGVTYRESGASNNGQGTCTTGGRYVAPNGNRTQWRVSEPQHPQCASVASAQAIVVRFSDVANYVKPTSGNMQLNFAVDPATLAERAVHYKAKSDWTTGFGTLVGTGSNGSTWTIDLAQVNASSNLISEPPRTLLVRACDASGSLGCHPATLSW